MVREAEVHISTMVQNAVDLSIRKGPKFDQSRDPHIVKTKNSTPLYKTIYVYVSPHDAQVKKLDYRKLLFLAISYMHTSIKIIVVMEQQRRISMPNQTSGCYQDYERSQYLE